MEAQGTAPDLKSLPAVILAAEELVREAARGKGYRLYMVGGAVRDLLLGRSACDIDIAIDADRFGDVVLDEFETRIVFKVRDVVGATRDEIVHRNHLIAARNKVIAEVRADESRTTRNEDPHW